MNAPKFKIGDIIVHKDHPGNTGKITAEVIGIKSDGYTVRNINGHNDIRFFGHIIVQNWKLLVDHQKIFKNDLRVVLNG